MRLEKVIPVSYEEYKKIANERPNYFTDQHVYRLISKNVCDDSFLFMASKQHRFEFIRILVFEQRTESLKALLEDGRFDFGEVGRWTCLHGGAFTQYEG
jgi:hypothetical protein